MAHLVNSGVPLVDIWRGDRVESQHLGHVVVCNDRGEVLMGAGDPAKIVYPRSSAKMIQALPVALSPVGSSLGSEQLALACASHNGDSIHRTRVAAWLDGLGLSEGALRCGAPTPLGKATAEELVRDGQSPCQFHSDCSGKHAGFLTLSQHLSAGPEYIEIDHPVQIAVKDRFEEVTGETSPGWGIDGCSAPNHQVSLRGMAHAMARYATAAGRRDALSAAMVRLVDAMRTHPELVAGEGRGCTELMRAAHGVALKNGAEGFYVGILPEQGLGIALKVTDGAKRGAEAAITQVLIKLGVLDAQHPDAWKRLGAPMLNYRGLEVGRMTAADALA